MALQGWKHSKAKFKKKEYEKANLSLQYSAGIC